MATRSTKKTRARYAAEYLLAPFLGSLLAVLFLESWSGRFPWTLVPVYETMPWLAIAANVLLLWMVAVFVAAITCRPRVALLATVDAYGLLFLLHSWKLAHVKAPLLVTDVLGWRDAIYAAMRYLSWGDTAVLAVLVAVPFITLAFPVIFPPFPGTRLFHVGLSLVTVVFFATFAVPDRTWKPWLAMAGFAVDGGDPGRQVREQGLLLTQALSWPLLRLGKPSPYGVTPVANVVRPFRDIATTTGAEDPVDVVLLVLEEFADPLRWHNPPGQDPLPFFRAEAALQSSGIVSLPETIVADGRAEFELLTGFSTALLPTPTVPYHRYVHRSLDALPRVFSRYGYRSVAIRPELPHRMGRSQAYPLLGFTESKFPRAAAPAESLPSDAIQEELDPAAAHFVVAFAVTPPETQVIEAGDARDAWLDRLRKTDDALKRFLEGVRTRPRRTMVVVLGAGLPNIPGLPRWLPDREDRFRAPLLVWTNYPRAQESLDENIVFLGAKIIEWAGVPSTPFFRFAKGASEKIAVLRSDVLRDRSGNIFPADGSRWQHGTQEVFPWVRSYWLIEYDQLFGARYASPPADAFATRLPPTPTPAGVRFVEADEPATPTPAPAAPSENAKARSASPTGP